MKDTPGPAFLSNFCLETKRKLIPSRQKYKAAQREIFRECLKVLIKHEEFQLNKNFRAQMSHLGRIRYTCEEKEASYWRNLPIKKESTISLQRKVRGILKDKTDIWFLRSIVKQRGADWVIYHGKINSTHQMMEILARR